ncbi:MAG: hypothetical protein ACI85O_003355 [Saprospiraceae bacterium]|jgi:hypothetical protein
MQSKTFLLFFFFSSFVNLSAQVITVSDDLSVRNDMSFDILGEMKGNLLLFRDRTTRFEVQAFNDKMRATWTKELLLDKRRPQIVDVISDKESFCVFYHFKRKGSTILKAHKYDPSANLIDSVVVKDFGSVFYTPDLQALASEDKSKIVFFEVENQVDVKAYSFDIKKMKLIWEESFKSKESSWNRDFREILTDNGGNFYLIFERDNRKTQLEKHRFEIYQLNGGPVKSKFVPMTEHVRYDVRFEYDNLNGKLVAGGLYSDESTAWARGSFYANFKLESPEEPDITYHPFDDEFVFNLMEESEKGMRNKKNKGITETNIQEIVLRRDGGILIIGEQNRHLDRGYGNARGSVGTVNSTYGGRYITDYFYDDLFVISYHPTGEQHWREVLHKKQYSQDDDAVYSSYFLAKTPSSLRLLFNDEIQYENTVSEYILKGNGDFTRNSVMSTENQRIRLRFKDALQISAEVVIVPSEARNRLKLVKVQY